MHNYTKTRDRNNLLTTASARHSGSSSGAGRDQPCQGWLELTRVRRWRGDPNKYTQATHAGLAQTGMDQRPGRTVSFRG